MSHQDSVDHTRRNIRWTIFFCVLFMVAVVSMVVNKIVTPRVMSNDELRINGAVMFDKPRRFDDFALVNEDGIAIDKSVFVGKWSLLFFGFTQCPDICPTTLADLSRLMGALPAEYAENTQVVLVSLDPARDTPQILKEYVAYFGQDFSAITGDFLTIRRFANQVNVAFNKVTQGDDYTVDHSGNIVLINPRGDYHGFFKPPFELAKLKATYSSIYQSFDH